KPVRAVFPFLANWKVMNAFKCVGGGKMLEQPSRDSIKGASAVGLITVANDCAESYITGGRAFQRLWLTANARGFSFHPMTAVTYMLERFKHSPADFPAEEQAFMHKLQREFLALFPHAADTANIMLFRITRAKPATTRAFRIPLEKVFT